MEIPKTFPWKFVIGAVLYFLFMGGALPFLMSAPSTLFVAFGGLAALVIHIFLIWKVVQFIAARSGEHFSTLRRLEYYLMHYPERFTDSELTNLARYVKRAQDTKETSR